MVYAGIPGIHYYAQPYRSTAKREVYSCEYIHLNKSKRGTGGVA
jgi:hypothetical protein